MQASLTIGCVVYFCFRFFTAQIFIG